MYTKKRSLPRNKVRNLKNKPGFYKDFAWGADILQRNPVSGGVADILQRNPVSGGVADILQRNPVSGDRPCR